MRLSTVDRCWISFRIKSLLAGVRDLERFAKAQGDASFCACGYSSAGALRRDAVRDGPYHRVCAARVGQSLS